VSRKSSRYLGDGLDFHVTEAAFAAFSLQTDFSCHDWFGRTVVEPLGIVKAFHDLGALFPSRPFQRSRHAGDWNPWLSNFTDKFEPPAAPRGMVLVRLFPNL
jgi:hypothetical protein